MFGNLDLDFKLIDLKCLDLKFIGFRSHFKFKHFKGLKFLVNLDFPDIFFLTSQTKIFGFELPKPNHVIQTHYRESKRTEREREIYWLLMKCILLSSSLRWPSWLSICCVFCMHINNLLN